MQYDGGAIFWSPSKVQDARDRQVQKEEAEKALQLQKDEEIKRKEEQKAEKARMLGERKRMKAVAKEIRLQEQRAKAAAREEAKMAPQADQQLKMTSSKPIRASRRLLHLLLLLLRMRRM
jgi:hypothetical protein